MKRDMDLVRTLLLAIEAGATEFGNGTSEVAIPFPADDVLEHLRLMKQAGFVEGDSEWIGGPMRFRGLTWEGHDFLDTVRDPEVWRRTRAGASKVGGLAFGAMKDMATAYAKHVAKERLGLDL